MEVIKIVNDRFHRGVRRHTSDFFNCGDRLIYKVGTTTRLVEVRMIDGPNNWGMSKLDCVILGKYFGKVKVSRLMAIKIV